MKKRVIRLTETDIRRIVQKVIKEQAQDYLTALKNAASGAGTNEKGLEELFASLKSKEDFVNLDNQIKSNPWIGQAFGGQTYSSIQDVLNGELEIGDYKSAERIKNSLKRIGVDLTFKGAKNTSRPEQGTVSVEPNSFVVNVSKTVGGGGAAATGGSVLDTVKTVFSDAVKGKISGIDAALKQFPNSKVFFVLDPKTGTQRYFQYTKDGSKLTSKGNWSIVNGKMSYQKDGGSATPQIGNVRVAPTEDAVKSGRAFVESTMSGDFVKKIQQALISQGFLKITKPTSYFGSKTDAAVRAFQKAKGLKEDGKVGKSTYNVLFSSTTPEADKRVPQEIMNIQPKGLANVTQGIQTPPQITRQGNIQTVSY
jgi:hypothetical protein